MLLRLPRSAQQQQLYRCHCPGLQRVQNNYGSRWLSHLDPTAGHGPWQPVLDAHDANRRQETGLPIITYPPHGDQYLGLLCTQL